MPPATGDGAQPARYSANRSDVSGKAANARNRRHGHGAQHELETRADAPDKVLRSFQGLALKDSPRLHWQRDVYAAQRVPPRLGEPQNQLTSP